MSLKSVFVIIIFFYVTILVHEFGHAFFQMIFKSTDIKIEIGLGDKLFSIGNITFNKKCIPVGCCFAEREKDYSSFESLCIFSGGMLFQIILVILIYLVVTLGLGINNVPSYMLYSLNFIINYNLYLIIYTMIPKQNFLTNNYSDGYRIIEVIKGLKEH